MKDIKLLAKELLSLTNKSECDESTIARMKNLICYLSEHKKNYQGSEEDKNRLDYIIYTACVKMRTFGYNRLKRKRYIHRDYILLYFFKLLLRSFSILSCKSHVRFSS